MQWLVFGSLLGMGIVASGEEPVWLKDYGQATAKALRENKPIFVVFR
jgi:hypothetical protein